MSAPRFFWLLELEAGGRTYRWSTEDLDVTTAAGDVLEYASGLSHPELAQGDDGVDIELVDSTVDWPAAGPLLDGARVKLRRWREGTAIERAEVYADGVATDPEWETVYDPVAFTVRAVETLPPMPDPDARVVFETTPVEQGVTEIPAGQAGRYYPVVYGRPGHVPGDLIPLGEGSTYTLIESLVPCVPCPLRTFWPGAADIYTSQIVVSEDSTKCLPSLVKVKDSSESVATLGNVYATIDTLGRSIAVADFTVQTGGNVVPYDQEDVAEYLAAYGPGGTEAPRTAYDVLVNAIQRWAGDTVDWARIPELRDPLSGFMIDTWVDDVVDGGVWSWFVRALGCADVGSTEAAGLPLAIRTSAAGRYFVPLRYQVDPLRSLRTVDVADGQASRVDAIRSRGKPVNRLIVEYRDAADAINMYHTSIEVGDGTANPSSVATLSRARYGLRQESLTVPWTWDPATAVRVAHVRLLRDALPWRRVQYRVPEEWGLREADQVRIVDEEVGLDEYAIIDGPPYISADGVTVTLRMPVR